MREQSTQGRAVPRKLERSSHEAVSQIRPPGKRSCTRSPWLGNSQRERERETVAHLIVGSYLPVYIERPGLTWAKHVVTQQCELSGERRLSTNCGPQLIPSPSV